MSLGSLQDVDIVVELFQVLLLDRGNALKDLIGVKDRLGVCEWVGGSSWRLAFDEGDAISADAESLKVSSGDVQIYLLAAVMDFADLVDHLRARWVNLVADLGDWR